MTQIITDKPTAEKAPRNPLFPPRPITVEVTVANRKTRKISVQRGRYGHYFETVALFSRKGYTVLQYRAIE